MLKRNPRCAVIYHSKYGNCEQIATAIAAGLQETGLKPYFVDVRSIAGLDSKLQAVFLGSPTRTSHATWRMRMFIKCFVNEQQRGMYFASFGTGLDTEIEKGSRQSSDEIHEVMCRKGLVPLAPPFRAAVHGCRAPIGCGELERAFRHGIELGEVLETKDRWGGEGELHHAI